MLETRNEMNSIKEAFNNGDMSSRYRLKTVLASLVQENMVVVDDLVFCEKVILSYVADGDYIESKNLLTCITRGESKQEIVQKQRNIWMRNFAYVLSRINGIPLEDMKRRAEGGAVDAAMEVGKYYFADAIGNGVKEIGLHYYELAARKGVIEAIEIITAYKTIVSTINQALYQNGDKSDSVKNEILQDLKYIYDWKRYEYSMITNGARVTQSVNMKELISELDDSRTLLAAFNEMWGNDSNAIALTNGFQDTASLIIYFSCVLDRAQTLDDYRRIQNGLFKAFQDVQYLSNEKPFAIETCLLIAITVAAKITKSLDSDLAAYNLLLSCQRFITFDKLKPVLQGEIEKYRV